MYIFYIFRKSGTLFLLDDERNANIWRLQVMSRYAHSETAFTISGIYSAFACIRDTLHLFIVLYKF